MRQQCRRGLPGLNGKFALANSNTSVLRGWAVGTRLTAPGREPTGLSNRCLYIAMLRRSSRCLPIWIKAMTMARPPRVMAIRGHLGGTSPYCVGQVLGGAGAFTGPAGSGRTPTPATCMLAAGRNFHAVFTRSPRQFHLPGADCCCGMLAHPNSRTRNGWSVSAEATGSYPPSESRTRVPGDPSRAARLIPRIPGAVRLWPKWDWASRDTLLGLHDTGGTNEQPSQLRSRPGHTRCGPAR